MKQKNNSEILCEICRTKLPFKVKSLPWIDLLSSPYLRKLIQPTLKFVFHLVILSAFHKLEQKFITILYQKIKTDYFGILIHYPGIYLVLSVIKFLLFHFLYYFST
eukprot:UN05706